MLLISKFSISQCCLAALFLITAANNVSCTPAKKVVYFNDIIDSAGVGKLREAQIVFESVIQKSDQLAISVGGSNMDDLAMLNSAGGAVGAASVALTGNPTAGFLVEADGNIKLPLLGKVKAEGLTRLQLEATLTGLLSNYTKNPVVNVRFINYAFSVIGEVAKAGRFNMSTERTTILEAISMAGDLTSLAKRENILVIREENGQRTTGRLNLLSKDIFNSPFFYVKTNDVIYVEPVNIKFITRNGASQYLTIAAVGLSLIITLINLNK
jgi:polysaccharide biosynthesis/export protein